jgi:protein phosphatase
MCGGADFASAILAVRKTLRRSIMPAQKPDATLDALNEATPEFEDRQPPRVVIKFGALSDCGKLRDNNEDHYLVARLAKSIQVCKTSLPEPKSAVCPEEDGYLIVVADGMGGEAAGERASALAVESIEAFASSTLKWFLHSTDGEEKELVSELRHSLEQADRIVVSRGANYPAFYKMGTTLTMAYSVGTDLFIVHAGDSRAYLYRDGELRQLTSDHTLAQLLIDSGTISPEQAKRHQARNVVTNAIGGANEGVFAEIHKINIRDGDILLLCTDGLTEPVSDEAIGEVLDKYADPQEACGRLVDLALDGGGPDNVTAVVVRYRVEQ